LTLPLGNSYDGWSFFQRRSPTISAQQRYFGRPVKRVEDPRLITGRGRYVDDIDLPGTLHAAFVRSPHAHARIVSVDGSRAVKHAGVVAVFTASDMPATSSMRSGQVTDLDECKVTEWSVLADGVARYDGEAVAVVVAADRYAAADGAGLVDVTYESRPAVVEIDDALRAGAARVHEGWVDNVLMRARGGGGDVAAAFAAADIVMTETFQSEAVTGVPMEPRGSLAALDASTGVLTVWNSHQTPHVLRSLLADHLGHAEHRIRVISPDMGGGFGIKTHLYPEDIVVPFLALTLRRPVKWIQTRSEDFRSNTYCRDHRITVEIAAAKDGRLLGMRARIAMNAGAYAILPGFGSILEATGAARQILGPYRISAYEYEAMTVVSHKPPRGAYRGVAMVTTVFSVERMMDLLAARTGLDRAEVRRINLISKAEFPYKNALGVAYDGASFTESLDVGLRRVDVAAFAAEQVRLRAEGRAVGLGFATYAEFTAPNSKALAWRGIVRVPGFDSTKISIDPSGKVRAYTSLTAMGQGVETTLGQIISEVLGVDLADVTVSCGDSTLAPYGSGAFASRGAVVGGGATMLAARKLRDKVLSIAARELEAEARDLEIAEGQVFVKGAPFRSVAFREIARRAYMVSEVGLADGIEPGLEATTYYDPPIQTISNGTHLALVEVDRETGRVKVLRYVVAHDCGTVINPMIVDGQIHGGVAQGIGQALGEAARYDEHGQLLSASLMDYLLPRAADLPAEFEIEHLETPAPATVGGMKGMGEGGTIGAVAAVANAVADALGPLGVSVNRLPLAPERVFALLRDAGRRHS
jgi:carbon-monoxide dehydrogenase large subunit